MENLVELIMKSAQMFIELGIQLVILFISLSYVIGLVQSFIPPEKIKNILSSKGGYFMAALLGALTPFCSATTIPFIKGLIRANAGFGSIMVFLFASPLLNPMILGLLYMTFGINVTLVYVTVSLSISVLAGYLLNKFGFENQIKESVYYTSAFSECKSECGSKNITGNLFIRTWKNTWHDFIQALPYLTIGVVVGSLVYGFVPTDFISSTAGGNNIFAVIVAAVIGIPLYISAEALIPLSSVLVAKGMGMGALMALIIGSAGASLTEVVLLKSIFHNKLISAFLFVVLGIAVTAGLTYNMIFTC